MQVTIEPEDAKSPWEVTAVYIDDRKCEYLGSSSRMVWGDGQYAVKLESENDANRLNQTLAEVVTWLRIEEQDQPYFAALYDYGTINGMHYTVQEQLNGEEDHDCDWYDQAFKLFTKYKLIDFRREQYLVVNGMLKIHDYGFIPYEDREEVYAE